MANNRKWYWALETTGLSASFDYGEVSAPDKEQARRIAERRIKHDVQNVNDALQHFDSTIGFKIEVNLNSLNIQEKD